MAAVKIAAFARQKMKLIGPSVNGIRVRGLRDSTGVIRAYLICSSSVADLTESDVSVAFFVPYHVSRKLMRFGFC